MPGILNSLEVAPDACTHAIRGSSSRGLWNKCGIGDWNHGIITPDWWYNQRRITHNYALKHGITIENIKYAYLFNRIYLEGKKTINYLGQVTENKLRKYKNAYFYSREIVEEW